MWSQWEEDGAWSDSLLRSIETSFPMMHGEGDSEEQISEKLSVYQVILINTCALSDRRRIILIYGESADRRTASAFCSCSILLIWRLLGALSTLYFVHGTQNLIGSIKYK